MHDVLRLRTIFVNTRLFSVIFVACHTIVVYLSSANKEKYKKQLLVSENLYFQVIEIGKVHSVSNYKL